MKRYAFTLTIILLLFAAIALAAPGDKRPAVTSAAIGLGTSSSPTLASITATTSVTAPTFASSAADGYHYIMPYNSIAFAGTPLAGMFVTTPTGPQWYTGSAWEAIGGGAWGSITGTLSAQTDLQTALNAKASTSYVDTAIAGVTAGTIPFVSDTTPPSAENSINYSRSDHKFRFRYPGGDVYVSAAMTLETAADTTPNAFAFTDETDVAADGGQSCGAAITVGGTNYPTTISATGDAGYGYKINGGAFTSASGTYAPNDTVAPCVNRSSSPSTATTATITIGGVSDTYSVTTTSGSAYSTSDNFNRTAQNPIADGLDTSTTPTGTWSTAYGYNPMQIVTNYTRGSVSSAPNASIFTYYAWRADQYSEATMVLAGGTPGVVVRGNTTTGTLYRLTASGAAYQIHKCTTSDSCVQLGSNYTAHAPAANDVIRLSVTGSATVTLTPTIAGTTYSSVTDSSTPITSGSPGIYQGSNNGSIDNWAGGEL